MTVRKLTPNDYGALNLGGAQFSIFICDTTVELPSGVAPMQFRKGDLAVVNDTTDLYAASSSTTWKLISGGGGGGGSVAPATSVTNEQAFGLAPVVGSDLAYARALHSHGSVPHDSHTLLAGITADQHHPQNHGAAQHTDVTRYFWMTPGAGSVSTPANLVAIAAGPVYQFPDAATETVRVDFPLPGDWVSGLGYSIHWTSSTSGAGSVRWSSTIAYPVAGTDLTVAGTTAAFTGTGGTKTLNVLNVEPEQALAAPVANSIVRFSLSRLGADAGNTYHGLAQLIGVRFSYLASA